jgi:hypothetical protein
MKGWTSPLGDKFHPWRPGVKLRMALRDVTARPRRRGWHHCSWLFAMPLFITLSLCLFVGKKLLKQPKMWNFIFVTPNPAECANKSWMTDFKFVQRLFRNECSRHWKNTPWWESHSIHSWQIFDTYNFRFYFVCMSWNESWHAFHANHQRLFRPKKPCAYKYINMCMYEDILFFGINTGRTINWLFLPLQQHTKGGSL